MLNCLHRALIQHASVVPGGPSPALHSARTALRLTVDTRKTYKDLPKWMWASHCHWVLLHAPFTPFTVTFCHIVANPTISSDDLELLANFVSALQSLSHISEGVAKLYRLCDVFQKVADLYVQAKTQEAHHAQANDGDISSFGGSMQPAISDIDDYLQAIGFAPPPPVDMQDFNNTGQLSEAPFDANYLNDWYYGNSSMIGMLEQDMAFPGDQTSNYGSFSQ